MQPHASRNYLPLGDSALLINYGQSINQATHRQVLHDLHALQNSLPYFVKDLVPAYTSLTLIYDMLQARELPGPGTIYSRVQATVADILGKAAAFEVPSPRLLEVPLCYDLSLAPDLADAAKLKGMPTQEIIEIHSSATYTVYMLGFVPGFAYMGEVDERIALPRLKTPRTMVAKGSVGIAGRQTGIYPIASPGGWQLIGRTPLQLFDPQKDPPAYFQPGDQVKFYPISLHEFENY